MDKKSKTQIKAKKPSGSAIFLMAWFFLGMFLIHIGIFIGYLSLQQTWIYTGLCFIFEAFVLAFIRWHYSEGG